MAASPCVGYAKAALPFAASPCKGHSKLQLHPDRAIFGFAQKRLRRCSLVLSGLRFLKLYSVFCAICGYALDGLFPCCSCAVSGLCHERLRPRRATPCVTTHVVGLARRGYALVWPRHARSRPSGATPCATRPSRPTLCALRPSGVVRWAAMPKWTNDTEDVMGPMSDG